MLNFIRKTNQWYESLPEVKGSLFYLALIFVPYCLLMFLLMTFFVDKPYYLISILWPVLVSIWRLSYQLIKSK